MKTRREEVLEQMHTLSERLDNLKLHYRGYEDQDDEIEDIEDELDALEDELDMIDYYDDTI